MIPIDALPSRDGNVIFGENGVQCAVVAKCRLAEVPAGMPRYHCHFATCPASADHRRR